mgnify:FL=1
MGTWKSFKKKQNELARRVERLEKSNLEHNSDTKHFRLSRRKAIIKTFLAVMGVATVPFAVVTQCQSIFPKPKLQFTSEVCSPHDAGEGSDLRQNPGGVNFTIRNSGNAAVLFTKAHIVIEDYAHLAACTYGSGPVPVDFCYDVVLPVDVEPGTSIDATIRHEVRINESVNFNINISLSDNSSEELEGSSNGKRTDYLDVHVYRLHIFLIQDDGVSNDAGRFIVAAPRDNIIGKYWKPDEIMFPGSSRAITKEQEIRDGGVTGEDYDEVLRCLDKNERELLRVLSVKSQMSDNLSQLVFALKSRRYTFPSSTKAPSNKITDCPE